MWSQRVDGQDALVREAPLTAGNEDRQQLTVGRDVTAGVIVDFTVWHQNVDGSWEIKHFLFSLFVCLMNISGSSSAAVPLLISGRSNLVKSHHCRRYVVLAMLLATAD